MSVAVDPVNLLAKSSSEMGITTPFLSDEKREMSKSYGVLRWAMPGNEPGHTFVLIKADGTVGWVRDYGARENGGLMYVAVDDLYKELAPRV